MCIVANILRRQKQFSHIQCVLGKLHNGNVNGIKPSQRRHGVVWKYGEWHSAAILFKYHFLFFAMNS